MAKKTFINEQSEYEKRYSEYMASKRNQEAKKGGDIVRKGTNKFAEDYLHPAMKAAAGITPVGPIVGLMDAHKSYKDGDKTGAIIGAGMEAIPGIAGLAKSGTKIAKNMVEQSAKYANQFDYSKVKPINAYASNLRSR